MKVVTTIKALRRLCSGSKGTIGFVPTMGYFHAGHIALMQRAKNEHAVCVVSIFVNPAQFAPGEDYGSYPRDLIRDKKMAAGAGVDILFVPSVMEMYPDGELSTHVDVSGLSEGLCGAKRPGHFRGVAVIVTKLLNIVQPRAMYLGQKDAQQVAVLRRLICDLNFPVTLKVCPVVRDSDGLALSSRNARLSKAERSCAPALFRALQEGRRAILAGESDAEKIINLIKKLLVEETGATIDYVAVVDVSSLQPCRRIDGDVLVALAVVFPSARLIDNIVVRV